MSDPDDDLDLTRQHFAEVRTGSVPNCARTVPIGNTSEQTCSQLTSEHFYHTSEQFGRHPRNRLIARLPGALLKWRLVVGGSAAALALALAPVIARAARTVATRLRIHRLRSSLSALSLHAATARGIGQYLGNIRDQDTRERIHSLQKIQRRAIAGLEAARSHVDRHLLALLDGGAF